MIGAVLSGIVGATGMLAISGAVVVAWWIGASIRDRGGPPARARLQVGLAVVAIAVLGSILMGSGHHVKGFFYLATLFGLPAALGCVPRATLQRLRTLVLDADRPAAG
jgi:hypothetical protein